MSLFVSRSAEDKFVGAAVNLIGALAGLVDVLTVVLEDYARANFPKHPKRVPRSD